MKSISKFAKDWVLGDPIQDWGTVYLQQGRFATEQLSLALYRKSGKLNLALNITYKTILGPNVWLIVFSSVNLPEYVERLETGYTEFCRIACQPERHPATGADKLPFTTRLILKLVFGLRGSKLLLDTTPYKDMFKIYAFVTRRRKRKVLIAPNYISSDAGNVLSAEGFKAVLDALSAYAKAPGRANTGDRQQGSRSASPGQPGCGTSAAPV